MVLSMCRSFHSKGVSMPLHVQVFGPVYMSQFRSVNEAELCCHPAELLEYPPKKVLRIKA